MVNLLEHLGKDTLPKPMLEAFVHWCVWEQARPALVEVLGKAGLDNLVADLKATSTIDSLEEVSRRAGNFAHEARKATGPLGMSAAEAAAFEMLNLAQAAADADWDPESVAFFSARVCGWAGWAQTDFRDPTKKISAEQSAREEQETRLQSLWQKHGTANADE